MNASRTFLTAEWRMAAMLNYEVDAALLEKLVPSGTELDRWQGKLFVSLVGFRFLNTKVLGMAIPFHRNFDEVNLRFYVRRRAGDEVRRGVVFIREIVPRWAIATVARVVYNENYVALPMWHRIDPREDGGVNAEYGWRTSQGRNQIHLRTSGAATLPEEGSEEQFITEHYWGYAAQRDGGCVEYRVEHPSWRVWRAASVQFEGHTEDLYGPELAAVLKRRPASAFLAEGSEVTVRKGSRLMKDDGG
ncbi:MAG: DUF2071 domain-containing protein [Acidobacteriia bacterium]|nr:DUF2071 domain-containing protein [Terriglobia bacterium]